MQRAALLLSGAGAAAAGQRRGPRASSPALAPGGARAVHDVSCTTVRVAPGDARGGIRLGSFSGGGGSGRENHQQKLKHRGSETEGEKARRCTGTVTSQIIARNDGLLKYTTEKHIIYVFL